MAKKKLEEFNKAISEFNEAQVNKFDACIRLIGLCDDFTQAFEACAKTDLTRLNEMTGISEDSLKWVCDGLEIMPYSLLAFYTEHNRFPVMNEI